MNKIILLSLLTVVGILGAGQMVLAANATLSVSPATTTNVVGTVFNTSIQLNPASNKVCVVKGTLSFNGIACQNITVASGVMAQTVPTCSNPSFVIGIPKCATTAQTIISVAVKGNQAGQAGLSISNVKVIGAGADVAFNSQGGTYNITATQVTPNITPKVTPKATTTPTTQSNQQGTQVTQEVVTPAEQIAQQPADLTGQQASLVTASPIKTISIVVVILLIIGGGWYLISRRKKK